VRRLHSGLRRAGTLQAPPLKGHSQQPYSDARSPSPTGADEEYDYDNDSVRAEEDGYFRGPSQQGSQGQYPTSPIGRSSPWSTPGASNDWRTQLQGNINPNIGSGPSGIDDVSRALSTLEINQQYAAGNAGNGYQQGQSTYPPRFNPPHNFVLQAPGARGGVGSGNGASRKLHLVTDLDNPLQQGSVQSASAYVPPIGHGMQQNQPQRQNDRDDQHTRDRAFTASGSGPWDAKERFMGSRMSNPNLHNVYQTKNGGAGIPSVPSIPAQYLNQGQGPRMGLANASQGNQQSPEGRGSSQGSNAQSPPGDALITSPIDVPSLIATKGYNPAEFDTRPLFVSCSCDPVQLVGRDHQLTSLTDDRPVTS
jgi:YTH domain-containing family protein